MATEMMTRGARWGAPCFLLEAGHDTSGSRAQAEAENERRNARTQAERGGDTARAVQRAEGVAHGRSRCGRPGGTPDDRQKTRHEGDQREGSTPRPHRVGAMAKSWKDTDTMGSGDPPQKRGGSPWGSCARQT